MTFLSASQRSAKLILKDKAKGSIKDYEVDYIWRNVKKTLEDFEKAAQKT